MTFIFYFRKINLDKGQYMILVILNTSNLISNFKLVIEIDFN